MGWDHAARQRRLAPIGEYRPEPYRVVVHDTFEQYRLRTAALTLCRKSDIPEFLLFCAEYVLTRHPELKRFRRVFRKGAREILAAAAEPIGPGFLEPESERERRRQRALDRFCTWAGPALREDTAGEKGEAHPSAAGLARARADPG
jgi:hypothetical protein